MIDVREILAVCGFIFIVVGSWLITPGFGVLTIGIGILGLCTYLGSE
jgi:hypothetical protein